MMLVIVLSSMTAYAITCFRCRFGSAVLTLFLIGMMILMQATLLPLMVMFKNAHILNTYFSLILPYIAFRHRLRSSSYLALCGLFPTKLKNPTTLTERAFIVFPAV